MPKTIDKFYDLLRQASQSDTPSPEYRKITQELVDAETALHKTFSDEQGQLYERLCYQKYRLDCLEAHGDFSSGFAWGSRLMMDVLLEK